MLVGDPFLRSFKVFPGFFEGPVPPIPPSFLKKVYRGDHTVGEVSVKINQSSNRVTASGCSTISFASAVRRN